MGLTIMQRMLTSPVGDIVRRLPTLPNNLLERYKLEQRIRPGDFYINGYNHHPCLAVDLELISTSVVGPWNYEIVGVSIVDGETETSNSAKHSGLTALPYEVAVSFFIVTFWERGTGPKVWEDAIDHVGKMLESNKEYQAYASTKYK